MDAAWCGRRTPAEPRLHRLRVVQQSPDLESPRGTDRHFLEACSHAPPRLRRLVSPRLMMSSRSPVTRPLSYRNSRLFVLILHHTSDPAPLYTTSFGGDGGRGSSPVFSRFLQSSHSFSRFEAGSPSVRLSSSFKQCSHSRGCRTHLIHDDGGIFLGSASHWGDLETKPASSAYTIADTAVQPSAPAPGESPSFFLSPRPHRLTIR